MKKNILKMTTLGIGLVSIFGLSSCDDNEMMMESSVEKTITFENVVAPKDFVESGNFPNVIDPGASVTVKFSAGKTQSLMFATMYGESKDWFFASKQPGIKLFDSNGIAITGDVSSEVVLWDNGTKENIMGQAENKPIALVPGIVASDLVKLNLAYNAVSSEFTLTISNASAATATPIHLSPGVWAVSNYNGSQLLNSAPFFTPNALSNPEITDIAQMGDITKMVTTLNANTGIMTGLSPALVVVYRGDKNPIYQLGQLDSGNGLKEIAQFGDVTKLQNTLKSLSNVKGVYIAGNAPLAPGSKMMTSFSYTLGDKIAYVTMFGFSNDWFYANELNIDANTTGD